MILNWALKYPPTAYFKLSVTMVILCTMGSGKIRLAQMMMFSLSAIKK